MLHYYNENDRKTAAWLRSLISAGLIPDGHVDERSICDVRAADLAGFVQCHFFAGIGGWPLAFALAGVSDREGWWSGSAPCQPFSQAGKRKGNADERHLAPVFIELIRQCRPAAVFGEQVASSDVVGSELEASFVVAVQAGNFAKANKLAKRLIASASFHYHPRWFDGICTELEAEDYAVWSSVLGAHSINAPHIRQRLFWVADAAGKRLTRPAAGTERGRLGPSVNGSPTCRMANAGRECDEPHGIGRNAPSADGEIEGAQEERERSRANAANRCETGRVVLADSAGRNAGRTTVETAGHRRATQPAGGIGWVADSDMSSGDERPRIGEQSVHHKNGDAGFWSDFDIIPCGDGKARRVESGTFPLAHGIPGRVGLLRGYGNAIVPQVAAQFIRAYLEIE